MRAINYGRVDMDLQIDYSININKDKVRTFKTRVSILNFLNRCSEEQLEDIFKFNCVLKGKKAKYTRDEKINSIMEGLY